MLDRETFAQDPAHPDPDPDDPRVRDRRGLPLRLQGPRHGVRRGARVRARRRRAHHRLERHRAHGRALRQAVRRGARAHGAPARRRLGLAAVRLAVPAEARLAAELAAVLAFSAVANHDRVGAVLFSDRIEGYVPPARGRDHALRIVRDLLALEPRGRGTDLAGALRFAQRVHEAARHRGRRLRLPGRGLRAGARRPAPPPRRGRAPPRRPARGRPARGRASWPSSTPRPASAWWSTPRDPRCGARCAPRASTAARAVFSARGSTRSRSRTAESYERPLRRSSRRGSGGGEVLARSLAARSPRPTAARPARAERRAVRRRDRDREQDRGHGRRDVHGRGGGDRARRDDVHLPRRGLGASALELRDAAPAGAGAARARAGHAPLRGRGLRAGRGAGPADPGPLPAARRHRGRGVDRAPSREDRLAAAEGPEASRSSPTSAARCRVRDRPRVLDRARRSRSLLVAALVVLARAPPARGGGPLAARRARSSPPDVEALARPRRARRPRASWRAASYRGFYIALDRDREALPRAPARRAGPGDDHGGDAGVPARPPARRRPAAAMRDLAGAADQIKFARGEGLRTRPSGTWPRCAALVAALEARLRPARRRRPEGKAA